MALARKSSKPLGGGGGSSGNGLKKKLVPDEHTTAPTSLKKKSRDTVEEKPKRNRKSREQIMEEHDELEEMDAELQSILPEHGVNEESVYLQEYLQTYKRLRKLIKLSYAQCISGRAPMQQHYILNGYISQQREVINDLRSMTDASGQVDMLVQQVLTPLSEQMSQLLLNTFYSLKKLSAETSKDTDTQFALSEISKTFGAAGEHIESFMITAQAKLEDLLLTKPHDKPAKGKKRK